MDDFMDDSWIPEVEEMFKNWLSEWVEGVLGHPPQKVYVEFLMENDEWVWEINTMTHPTSENVTVFWDSYSDRGASLLSVLMHDDVLDDARVISELITEMQEALQLVTAARRLTDD